MRPSGLAPDETIALIGTAFVRQSAGPIRQLVFSFAAIQTDWKWMARYLFIEKLTRRDQLAIDNVMVAAGTPDYATSYSVNGSSFHRSFLHLSQPLRIDEMTGFGADRSADHTAKASLFAHNGTKKGNIFVDLEIDHTENRPLTLRQIHLDGSVDGQINGERHRGSLFLMDVQPYKAKLLKHPPGMPV
jgi:hypothetical protein